MCLYYVLNKDDNMPDLLHGFSHTAKGKYLTIISLIYILRVKRYLFRLRKIIAPSLKSLFKMKNKYHCLNVPSECIFSATIHDASH